LFCEQRPEIVWLYLLFNLLFPAGSLVFGSRMFNRLQFSCIFLRTLKVKPISMIHASTQKKELTLHLFYTSTRYFFIFLRLTGPSYMVSGTKDSPPPKATLSSVYMWKRNPCRSNRSCSCMIIHNPYWIIKCTVNPLSLSFHSEFRWVNFDLFDTNLCFKPKI